MSALDWLFVRSAPSTKATSHEGDSESTKTLVFLEDDNFHLRCVRKLAAGNSVGELMRTAGAARAVHRIGELR